MEEGMSVKIFIVEDDREIRELESYALNTSGYETECFSDGESFFEGLKGERPSLVLLDVMLPGISGLDILRIIRQRPDLRDIPVILVTAKSSELDTVRGLDMGADDYITKPFGIMELVSRVRARTRNLAAEEKPLVYEDIFLDHSSRSLTVAGRPIELTYKEYELLHLLLSNAERVMSRDLIMEKIWGYDFGGSSRTLDMHIKTLRQKLGGSGALIRTIRNVGYCLGRTE